DISAYIGLEQLKVLDNRIKQRKSVNSFYRDLFNSFDEIKLLQEFDKNISSNHWLSVIFLKDNNQREKLRQSLANNNIESRPVWKPMHIQPLYKDAMYFGENISNNAFTRGLCLPSGSNLNNDDKLRIKNCILHTLTQ
ncbi:DegT/DnrJ/EryC1/StrS family aminotransferase, partial [Ornithobacterium rhinotracheale]